MATIAGTLQAEAGARLLLRLLERRFGQLPAAVPDRVRGASVDDIDAWADAVLDAVFAAWDRPRPGSAGDAGKQRLEPPSG